MTDFVSTWNSDSFLTYPVGPLGLIAMPGTEMMGEKEDAETIVCGGDTTGFVENLMLEHSNLKYSLVSTGGGAALEFLLGKKLPGIEVLETK